MKKTIAMYLSVFLIQMISTYLVYSYGCVRGVMDIEVLERKKISEYRNHTIYGYCKNIVVDLNSTCPHLDHTLTINDDLIVCKCKNLYSKRTIRLGNSVELICESPLLKMVQIRTGDYPVFSCVMGDANE